jgi:hypothetical protein
LLLRLHERVRGERPSSYPPAPLVAGGSPSPHKLPQPTSGPVSVEACDGTRSMTSVGAHEARNSWPGLQNKTALCGARHTATEKRRSSSPHCGLSAPASAGDAGATGGLAKLRTEGWGLRPPCHFTFGKGRGHGITARDGAFAIIPLVLFGAAF